MSVAVRAFLDRYGPEVWTDEEADAAISELDKRMHGRFHDEWLAMRAEKGTESFADLNPERAEEVRVAVQEQLKDPARNAGA